MWAPRRRFRPPWGDVSENKRFNYQPALDGLRAFAVLSVFAYHLDAGWARGGFLGVDAFFVLSGFLITSLLVGEWARHGGISFAGFWARRARRLLPALLLVLLAVAAMAVLYDRSDPSRAYYGTDSRAHLLLIGAGLALILARWTPQRAARSSVNALGLAGAVACLAFWAFVPDTAPWMYRGGYAVFGVCVAAVITSAVQPGRFALRSFLSLPPLVWIGRISYGLYLWHWPVIVVASPARTGLDGAQLTVVRVALTFALATASFYLVEQPIRRGVLRGRWALAVSPSAFVATGVVVLVATAGAAPLPKYLQGGPNQLTSRAEQLPSPQA